MYEENLCKHKINSVTTRAEDGKKIEIKDTRKVISQTSEI